MPKRIKPEKVEKDTYQQVVELEDQKVELVEQMSTLTDEFLALNQEQITVIKNEEEEEDEKKLRPLIGVRYRTAVLCSLYCPEKGIVEDVSIGPKTLIQGILARLKSRVERLSNPLSSLLGH